ncbi:hypothetical protein NC653_033071 [Populus alba x Populus x berolinensis]|uniref:Uncharacterized protein n=1 Tax=Populus alba x Populus x berolinensis TaxID=444605 RepID=A0AAD6LSW0_9ROSI|nr:hypothetical protein NC653_033071 [Populus alba x Populus x berolinensis]
MFLHGRGKQPKGRYVLCKLKKKPDVKTNKGEPNHHMVSTSDFKAAPNCSIEGECGPSMEMPSKKKTM